jgi:PadR family transcriptional regulator
MKKQDPLGQLEQVVLTAVLMQRDHAYGAAVHTRVVALADRPIILPAVYVTLDRLEEKGYLSSTLSDPTPERGGRAKRMYHLTAAGRRVLQESAATAGRVYEAVSEGFKKWGLQKR